MLRPRKTIDDADTRARFDGLQAAVRREAEGAEADPFDDAMLAAALGAADALKAETGALADVGARLGEAARNAGPPHDIDSVAAPSITVMRRWYEHGSKPVLVPTRYTGTRLAPKDWPVPAGWERRHTPRRRAGEGTP